MYAVAEHLVRDHGYRRFTYLAGPHGNTDANERRQAVFDVMNAYKVSFDESRVAYGDFSSCVQQQVNPPLTTVLQNAFDMGYMAMIGAAELCKGKKVIPL